MKKYLKPGLFLCILFSLAGCFSTKPNASLNNAALETLAPYSGPQVKIAVDDFELKTSSLDEQVSQALKEYFINVLSATKRFQVIAPQDADLIISVGIIEFIPENSGGRRGLAGGGSSASSFMGGLLGEVQSKANMQLSLRIIDRASSAIVGNRDIQSQIVENPDQKIKFPQDKVFKAGLIDYAGTAMGKVIYDCITEAGRFVVQSIPQNYYQAPSV